MELIHTKYNATAGSFKFLIPLGITAFIDEWLESRTGKLKLEGI